MAQKPLEEELAAFLLGCVRGPWMNRYAKECFQLWREKYGNHVVNRVKAILKDRLK